MDTCKVIQVIETTLTRHGDGTKGNPIRIVTQYWSLEGQLMWEVDEWANQAKHQKEKDDMETRHKENVSELQSLK